MGTMSRGVVLAAMLFAICVPRATAQWTQCEGPYGGYVNALVDGGTSLYAATAVQVYSYDKATARWRTFGAPLRGSWLQAVAVSGGSVLVGKANGEIHLSSDDGNTWSLAGTGWGTIYQFATTPTAIFAAAGAKLVIKSTNGGVTWSESGSGLEGSSAVAVFAATGKLLAATNAGVFRSEDEGGSWTKISDNGQIYSLFIDGTAIWAGGYQQVHRSTDDGATWTVMAGSTVFPHRVLCFARTASYLYAGALDGGIARSSDDGATWEKVNTKLPALRIYGLVANGTTVYAGTNAGGMYMLAEPGAEWTPRNEGMNAMSVRALLPTGQAMLAATDGRGIMVAQGSAYDNWTERNAGIPAPGILSLARAGSTILAGSDDYGLYRSEDEGLNWTPPGSGLAQGDIFALYARGGGDVFAGTNGKGVHYSSDAGDTWVQRGDSISGEAVWGLTALGPKLFAGMHRKGVLMSSDDGVNWVTAGEELAGRRIVAVHAHGNILFASVNNVATYRSTDEGMNWTTLGGLFNGRVAQCFLSIGTQILAGAAGGPFVSSDGGETWVAMDDGLPSETIYALSTQGDMLLAGLAYSGVWKRPLSEVILDVGDGTPSACAFRLHPVSPQPLRDRGTARFDLGTGADVVLELFDLLGRQVATAAAARYDAGSHVVTFDVAGLRTGCYLLRLQAGGMQAAQRVTVIR